MKGRITPISEMWFKARLIFFTDASGEIHDATGDVCWDGKFLVLGNRADGKRLQIARQAIILEEVLNDDKAG